MTYKIDDIVTHVDYPGTRGRVVGKFRNSLILVLWDKRPRQGMTAEINSRCSRHIPFALRPV